MITITGHFRVRPEWTDRWPGLVDEFTRATRQEPGNLFFHWSRDVDDPCVFYMLEGYTADGVREHLTSPLIPKIKEQWPQALVETPRVIMAEVPGDDWAVMERLPVR